MASTTVAAVAVVAVITVCGVATVVANDIVAAAAAAVDVNDDPAMLPVLLYCILHTLQCRSIVFKYILFPGRSVQYYLVESFVASIY